MHALVMTRAQVRQQDREQRQQTQSEATCDVHPIPLATNDREEDTPKQPTFDTQNEKEDTPKQPTIDPDDAEEEDVPEQPTTDESNPFSTMGDEALPYQQSVDVRHAERSS